MKYFGTDGIRGIVGKNLSIKTIKKVAHALVRFFKNETRKTLLVGNDSRISSDYCLSIIESVLLKNGITIENVGLCSSPCLAFLSKKFNYPLSLMFSASHNSSEYNGLKFFNNLGEKVSTSFELEFERLMDMRPPKSNNTYAKVVNAEKLKDEYINYLKSLVNSNIHCIIDCACGGASEIVKRVYPKTNIINANPTGLNINKNAGCTHIENLKILCAKNRCMGYALDGDADRLIIVDESGNIIDGDKILYILSKFYLKSNDVLVGTIYTNSGLEECLKKKQINLIRAQVGDKLVYKKMCENKSKLGGENSGHIILKYFSNTGDGLLNSIIISNILSSTNLSLKTILEGYIEYFQLMNNLQLEKPFVLTNNIKTIIKRYETDGTRIIIRPSGTEPVLRIMVESKDEENAKNIMNSLILHLKNTLI